jgi:spore maturation protein CgeB
MINRLLFFGELGWGTQCLQRFDAMRGSVGRLYGVDTRMFLGDNHTRKIWERVQIRIGLGSLVTSVSEGLIREARRYRPDAIWVESGLCVTAEAIQEIKAAMPTRFVHFTADSLRAPGWSNRCFPRALPHYDICFTIKARETVIYQNKGAKRVSVTHRGYDPDINRPVSLTPEDKKIYGCDVAFAGQRMDARARSLVKLSENSSVTINLYGRHWNKGDTGGILGPLDKGWLFHHEYTKALCAAKIVLAFLNREVQDTYTGRSIEIPACRAFMLAERTKDHTDLFVEGKEAEFFETDEELIDKVKFYVSHDSLREDIARAGHEKVKRLQLTWETIMKNCLDEVLQIQI